MFVGFIHEVTCLLLVGYVLSRQSRRFRDIGLSWSLKDIGVGLVVAVVSYASYWVGAVALNILHYTIFHTPVTGHSPKEIFGNVGVAIIPYSLLNPFFEELIVRAYLMTEIQDLTGSAILAIACSVLLQASYHLYYGWFGALSLSFQFLIFAIYYATRRRALPVIVAHGFFDIYGFIRLW
jgi:membrane protease YdiL (CAAX protease family)